MKLCKRPHTHKKGYIFVLALVTLAVLFILGVLSLRLASYSQFYASRERNLEKSFVLAEAAADWAEAYLRSSDPPPDSFTLSKKALGDGFISAVGQVYTEVETPGITIFKIEATGEYNSVERKVIMQLKQQSFALYSYFTDYEKSPSGSTIWFFERDRIYGPVHSNDKLHIKWSKTATDSIFHGTVSSANTSVQWDPSEPVTTNNWRRVFEGGKPTLKLGASRIELPITTLKQKIAAWGLSTAYPASAGVTLNSYGSELAGGIYISGTADYIHFSVDQATGNQVIDIKQTISNKTNLTNIVVDLEGNMTTKKTKVGTGAWSAPTTYYGTTNGVIYSTGDIKDLSGMIANNFVVGDAIAKRNAWTVMAEIDTSQGIARDITITDNLVYETPPDPTKPPTHTNNLYAPVLGLVGEDITLASGCPDDMSIDGVILAGGQNTTGGTFSNSTYSSDKKGNLHIRGGLIQKRRGPVGTFNSNGTHASGYVKDYKYDPRLATNPPPYFPTTGQYDIVSWQAD